MARQMPERLVVGLGNPGNAYAHTRHNIGFRGVDALSAHCRIPLAEFRSGSAFGVGEIHGHRIALVKPMTYMNRSGIPTGSLLAHWGLTCRDIIVIHDDMDLTFGRIKIKKKGGDGGHRGIRSLIDACGDDRFCRIRIGIGHSETDADPVDHVLGVFHNAETEALDRVIKTGVNAVIDVICEGAEAAMNRYNRKESRQF